MNITYATREEIGVIYTLNIEHGDDEFAWEVTSTDDNYEENFYLLEGAKRAPIPRPDWATDDFFDLWEQAEAEGLEVE